MIASVQAFGSSKQTTKFGTDANGLFIGTLGRARAAIEWSQGTQ